MGKENEDNDDVDNDDVEVDDDKTYSLAEVQAMMAKEKRQGGRHALRDLYTRLGVKNADELEDALTDPARGKGGDDDEDDDEDDGADAKAAERARKDRDRADKRTRDAEERERRAEEKEFKADLRIALVEADVAPKYLADAVRLLDVEVGSDPEEVEDAIEELRGRMPVLFSQPSGDDSDEDDASDNGKRSKGPVDSNPGKGRRKPPAKNSKSAAEERLARDFPQSDFAKSRQAS